MRLWRADQVEVTVLPQDSSSFVLCVEYPLCSFVLHAAAPPFPIALLVFTPGAGSCRVKAEQQQQ